MIGKTWRELSASERASLTVGSVLRLHGNPDLDLTLAHHGWVRRGQRTPQEDVGGARVVVYVPEPVVVEWAAKVLA